MSSFETRLQRLEEISMSIRGSSIELEEATSLFEEGITLARELEKELSRVEQKIEILVNSPSKEGEKPVLELFPELTEGNS
ncbi:exodeoxyribonuclease VII small subunit [Spirochaeta lutea]|uniref:Exodeoxyribonuclease 7 small subunit n=1 Tax=Spirochaeta lutea TaxID=1480694 RepID=A0A098R1W7_9SPIO|nr:exodeoxyribonuclease VII small subunit [Spirochaeta lutea]KGE73761.1 exodeoxyribonuclease VII [Spirochaeta lutea]